MDYETVKGTTPQIVNGHRFGFVIVTPNLAKEWLTKSAGNRSVRKAKQADYARQMIENRWGLISDPIAFDRNDKLINGHHRLGAVIKANKSIVMLVCFETSPESIDGIDITISRTLPDRFKMYRSEEKNRNLKAAIVNCCANLIMGYRITITRLDDYDRWYSILKPGVDLAVKMSINGDRIVKTAAVTGALALAYKRNPAKITMFGTKLAEGVGVQHGEPVWVLKRHLEKFAPKTYQVSVSGNNRINVSRSVLNAAMVDLTGGQITRLQSTDTGLNFFKEPYTKIPAVQEMVRLWLSVNLESDELAKKQAVLNVLHKTSTNVVNLSLTLKLPDHETQKYVDMLISEGYIKENSSGRFVVT